MPSRQEWKTKRGYEDGLLCGGRGYQGRCPDEHPSLKYSSVATPNSGYMKRDV